MTVEVLLFARYREVAGTSSLQIEARPEATLGDVWRDLVARVPALGREGPLMALDQAYARPETPVGDGREVAFFPPVSGG